MAEIQRKSFRGPDEEQIFPLGRSREVHLGELVVGLSHHEPGWRWSAHVKPIVGTRSCQVHHTGFLMSGRLRCRLEDGTEVELGTDDVFDIPAGHDAWVLGDEPAVTVEWVGAHRWASPPAGERILATLVITDIVDSTALAERIGDIDFARILEDHYARLRQVLDRYRGSQVTTTGDGLVAIFDGAERAVRAAAMMGQAVAPLDLRIRAGVHTGEVELVPGNVRGVAVHVAARIMALAGPGEVLVSGTTRDLIDSREVHFVDRGIHELKGVSGARTVFALKRS